VSPVKYELGFYIPEDDILTNHCRDNLKFYIISVSWAGPSPAWGYRMVPLPKMRCYSHSDWPIEGGAVAKLQPH
jgi:hypothetical protein